MILYFSTVFIISLRHPVFCGIDLVSQKHCHKDYSQYELTRLQNFSLKLAFFLVYRWKIYCPKVVPFCQLFFSIKLRRDSLKAVDCVSWLGITKNCWTFCLTPKQQTFKTHIEAGTRKKGCSVWLACSSNLPLLKDNHPLHHTHDVFWENLWDWSGWIFEGLQFSSYPSYNQWNQSDTT